ncbi:MAG: multidrug efflux system membrane fusion protein [Saprospiraceae bacterium]|jgi:multidrug efflux system membrane fusion protein
MKQKVLLSISVLLILSSCKVDYSAPDAGKMNEQTKNYVEIAKVIEQNDPIPIHAIGRLGSDQEVKLSFKIGGIISAINADEGDFVKAGKLLASIRTNEIDAQVLKAKRVLQKVERDLERIEKMYADSAATLENVQDLTTLSQVSKADLEIAEFNQKYARIISPVSGRIIRRLAEPNELVAPGQPIFLIATASGKTHVMKVALSDRDINRINPASKAKVYFDAFPDEYFDAQVSSIAENSDPVTGTFEVELAVDAKNKRLRNGFIGRVDLIPVSPGSYLTLPIDAVVEGDQKSLFIFIPTAADTIAKMISVQPFYITSSSVYVKRPESGNLTRVITSGAAYLVDGDRIFVRGEKLEVTGEK